MLRWSLVNHRLYPPEVAIVNGQRHLPEDPNGSVEAL
jgi:hypothetical protein